MSGVKLSRRVDTYVEVQAECRLCGLGLSSETADGAWQDRAVGSGSSRIVVKVTPCARCAREAREVNGASIRREGRS